MQEYELSEVVHYESNYI